MRPDPQQPPRLLTEAEPMPEAVTGRVAGLAIDTYQQLTCPEQPAAEPAWPAAEDPEAVGRAVGRVVADFRATAGTRDWTVPLERVRQLAADAIGLRWEYEHVHGYPPGAARLGALCECYDGEAARTVVWPPPPEVGPPAVPAPAGRVERARDGGER